MKKNLLLMVLFILSFGQVFAQTADDKDIDTLQKIIEQLQGDDRQSGLAQLSSQADILGSSLKVSKDADGYLLLGRAYFYAELDDQANKNLNLALKYNPLLPQAHFFSGLLAMFTGKLDDAEQSFRTAIQLDTGIDAYRNELARILVMKKDESGALMAFQNALKVNPENIEAQIGSAQIYMGQGNNEKAELLFLSTLKTDPDRIFVNSNLGQLYQNIENHKGALKYFTKAHQINPNDWRLTAKLIQEYHALGRMKERDDLRDKLYQTWGSGKAPDLNQQGFFVREQFITEGGKVFGMEYFELTGERATKYVFQQEDQISKSVKFKVSLGSYDNTIEILREMGDIGPDERLYHLDGYAPDGSHYTYGFFDEQLDYDTTRKLAIEVFNGERKEISSATDGSIRLHLPDGETQK